METVRQETPFPILYTMVQLAQLLGYKHLHWQERVGRKNASIPYLYPSLGRLEHLRRQLHGCRINFVRICQIGLQLKLIMIHADGIIYMQFYKLVNSFETSSPTTKLCMIIIIMTNDHQILILKMLVLRLAQVYGAEILFVGSTLQGSLINSAAK